MSLFIGIPVEKQEMEPVLAVAKQAFNGSSVIRWFDNGFHLTLAYLKTSSRKEEDRLVNRFRNGDWMERLSRSVCGFTITLNQLTVLGNGDTVTIAAPATSMKCRALQQIVTSSRRTLARLAEEKQTNTRRGLFRPHISLGEIVTRPVKADDSLYDILNPNGNGELSLTVTRIVLFRKPFGESNREYQIIQEGILATSRDQKAP